MTLLVIQAETLALNTTITITLVVVIGILPLSTHGTNAVSAEAVSIMLSTKMHALTMTPPGMVPETLALSGMIDIHLVVETTILATSLQMINAASVVEVPTLPPELLRMQLPSFVLMMTRLLTYTGRLALVGMIHTHLGVEAMMIATSLQLKLVVLAEEAHLLISHPTKLVQLQLVASTMTLSQTDLETLAQAGMIHIHLHVETTILLNLPPLMSVALVEEVVDLDLLVPLLLVLARPISQPQMLLETPAPGTTCWVELDVMALLMMLTSQLKNSAALAVVVTIDAQIKPYSFA